MKKIIMLFFLFSISIVSFSATTEKSAEEIMEELREKVARREEEKIRQEQERLKKEEEIKQQKALEESRKKEESEKEATKLMNEKRRQLISEPLEDKYGRADDKTEAYDKALKVGEARMSFIRFKEKNNGESGDTLSKRYDDIYKNYEDTQNERQKILSEREKIQKQMKALDELEEKVKDW